MKFLGKEYSEKLDRLWGQIGRPKPLISDYPQQLLSTGRDPRFAGMHIYQPAVGDLVYIVPGEASEYTLGHELMHVVLRRKQYPHLTFRRLGPDLETLLAFTQHLESVMLHPLLNSRLAVLGIAVPPEYSEAEIRRCQASATDYQFCIKGVQEHLPIWSLLLTEMTMWNLCSESELRSRLNFPEAWELATQLLAEGKGLASGSPKHCHDFALKAVKLIDDYLKSNFSLEQNYYFRRVCFPPPPFASNPDLPAKDQFSLSLNRLSSGGWEIEVSSTVTPSLCWTDGPFDPTNAENRFALLFAAIDRFSAKDFADSCERLLSTVMF